MDKTAYLLSRLDDLSDQIEGIEINPEDGQLPDRTNELKIALMSLTDIVQSLTEYVRGIRSDVT